MDASDFKGVRGAGIQFEITGITPAPVTVNLVQLAMWALGSQWADMVPGDSITIKRLPD